MGNPKPLRLDYYFRALEHFAPDMDADLKEMLSNPSAPYKSYGMCMNELQQTMAGGNIPVDVEYTKNSQDEVVIIYKNDQSQSACLYVGFTLKPGSVDTKIPSLTLKDIFCSQTAWDKQLRYTHRFATQVFISTLPFTDIKTTGAESTFIVDTKSYPGNKVPPIVHGARTLYDCYVQKVGSKACINEPLVVSAQQTIKQIDLENELENDRKKTDQLWSKARLFLREAEGRSGLFSSIKPEQIREIIEQYAVNPYVGLTPEESIKGRLAKAEEMMKRIENTDAYKETVSEREKQAQGYIHDSLGLERAKITPYKEHDGRY